MTESEKQVIIDAVLSALRTNSRTIEQLTPVSSLSSSDYFEVNGGRRIAYTVLAKLIATMSESEQSNLQTAIDRKELQSVAITTTQSSATLTIKSVGKTISCSIPIATSSQSGIITAADMVKLDAAYTNASSALNQANSAQSTANSAKSAADTANSGVSAINAKIGKPNGIAPLDASGKVPAANLPGYVDDVVEFNAFVSGITMQMQSSIHASTDSGCMVMYNRDTNRFVLAVSNRQVDASDWSTVLRPRKSELMVSPAIELGEITTGTSIKDFWTFENGSIAIIPSVFTFYPNWADAASFGVDDDTDGHIPESGKIYTCTSENKTFRWSGSELIAIGSDLALGHTASTAFPGDEGEQLAQELEWANRNINENRTRIEGLGILPCDGEWNGTGKEPAEGVWLCPNGEDNPSVYFRSFGSTNFYNIAEELYNSDMVYNPGWLYRTPEGIYRIENNKLVSISGSAVGNTYNATVELPLPAGEYYSDINAKEITHDVIDAVLAAGVASPGLQITFAIGAGSWKTYQYVGPNVTPTQFKNRANWIDLAGMSAGGESLININNLCGDKDYTISTAVQALIDLESATGINYRKEGLVLTYRRDRDSNTWETKQYHGVLTDMTATNEKQWDDFGGGGGSVEVVDVVEKGNDKPVTSNAVAVMSESDFIANFEEQSDAENIIYQGVNKKGEPVGDPLSIPRSSGGGQQTGSVLNIYPESQAVWGAFGSKITLRCAIKSVSFDGDTEILGTVRTISILDTLTRIELWSRTVNTTSSTSALDFKDEFEFDFTDYITSASSKDFLIRATDADGNTKTRQITVTAVDVTCTCIQTLNYSSATALEVGGREKSLPMYKFENNVSTKQGILVTTEMFFNGEWRVLGTATITDSYSHNISINPSDVFGGGEKMAHGAYPLRIQGKDLASGVIGNTIYTAVMCVDATASEPIVVMRYDDKNEGKVRLYDSVSVDVAAYTPGKTETPVEVVIDGAVAMTVKCPVGQPYNVSKQIQGYRADGTKSIDIFAQSGESKSETVTLVVSGSAIDASVKDGAVFSYDFSTRSNSETDHTISDNGVDMVLNGCNYNSNGFVNILGENVLRLAENVTGEIKYKPFDSSALETAGAAVQFAFSTKSIKDKDSMLCECYDPSAGVGFYVRGNEIVLTVLNGTPKRQRVGFKCGEKVTVAVVVEPGSKYVTYKPSGAASGTNYSFVKLFVNGEECAAIGYQPGTSALRQDKTIKFNSANGDFRLNYFIAYNSYMEWLQAFQNYLCKLSDVTAMIAEYDKENVLDTTGKPSMSLMAAKGIPYYVIVADQTTFNNFDYALNGGTSTSDQFACTLYYFNPEHPEVNFKAVNTLWRRQGTTSAQRPIKNDRFNFNKKNKSTGLKATVTLLNPDDSTELGRKAITAAKHNKVYVDETGHFVDVVTVKVDFSDSSNANDCGVCDMMNATFRALGSSYMTPAQRAFDGTQDLGGGDVLTGIQMDHSTKNHPIACFRATTDTLQDAWFHAKGNWKEDKGEQVALGFKDTSGYNKGCLNYGDFVEFFGTPDETLAQTEARFKTASDLNTSKPYLISQYCGRDYAIYRYKDGAWVRSTGSMKQVNGKWVVTGDVLNPVSGYELLQYAGMDWWQGVNTVEDMMKPSTQISSWVRKLGLAATEYPAWTYYFECMIDDDQLQEDLALGKKVPYDLFNMLRFLGSCDYSKVDGWEKIWRENAYRYMSMESGMAYTAFTDFLAAVDQRAKNMQPMFYLEDGCYVENGVYVGYKGMEPTRMYLNKVYDCDTCNGADNDGGRDIDPETDPNKPTDEAAGYTNPYMGYGSVLFNNMDKCQEVWNSNDLGATTISLKSVVNRMRNQTAEIDGKTMVPFSPDGALYFFVERRLKFWPKVISSYDGERKYIDNTGIANLPYFYALHGLGLTSLPRFIEQRWAIRDGYYQTGDFFTNPLSGRVSSIKSDSKIYIKAAATGYFGIGNDASGQLSESVYLEAGESHAFTNFAHDAGALLYIYQPGRMSMIDLSEMSLAFHFDDLSKLELAEEVILGGAKHTANSSLNGFNPLGSLILGDMPFLRTLDISNTTATSVDASGCPRVESINAANTNLTTCNLAQTSPIETLTLPATMTSLEFVNLPNLTYPGGLTLASVSKVSRIWIEGCKFIDTESLLMEVAQAGAVKEVRIPGVNVSASVKVLRMLLQTGAIGLDSSGNAYEESGKCSGVIGRWILTELIDEADIDGEAGLNSLNAYFPELEVINSQFSIIKTQDDDNDEENKMTNLDNNTGRDFNTPFVQSGHLLAIEQNTHSYKCTFNEKLNRMEGEELDDNDFNFLCDGSGIDLTDNAGEGYDIMWHLCHCWYKGINDFKNQVKYYVWSTTRNEPISTASKCVRKAISELLYRENCGVYINDAYVGVDADDVIATTANVNTYRMDVEGMKQVRWPGVNMSNLGCVFTDENGKVIEKFKMSVSNAQFDFDGTKGDYIFTDVPVGAKWFFFTTFIVVDQATECIAVDSASVEAIEPDWVEHKAAIEVGVECEGDSLIGNYPITMDALKRPRSVSSTGVSQKGTGTSTTAAWEYDADGNPTAIPTSTLNYTMKDFENLAWMRGPGFQLIDYEQHKETAIVWWCCRGRINEQAVVGNGQHNGRLNQLDNIGMKDSTYNGNNFNSLMGLKAFIGCNNDWMTNIAVNVTSYLDYKKRKGVEYADFPLDHTAHIYDPINKTERTLVLPDGAGDNVVRLIHGRRCDILPSRVDSGDRSKYVTDYCAGFWYTHGRSRVLLRSSVNAYARSGFAYANAVYASSLSNTYYGARLAFRGTFVIVKAKAR